MNGKTSVFEFSEAYRKLQPGADRATLAAREAAHGKLRPVLPKSPEKIVDLAFLAFDIPLPSGRSLEWLESVVREKDPHFSLKIDGQEARIVATLLLADIIASGFPDTPALVLAGSFAGRRPTVDDDRIVLEARKALAGMGRARGMSFGSRIGAAAWRDVSKSVANAKSGDPTAIHSALEAIATEAKTSEGRLVERFNAALQDLTRENLRLAEEVDLLWWHIGRTSYLLDKPLSEIDEKALPVVVGTDVAAMINVLPGPHGALGIIRQALGDHADARQTIKAAFDAISSSDRANLLKDANPDPAPIATLNAGLRLHDDEAIAASVSAIFEKRTGVSIDLELSRYEIAVQAFYERMLIKSGWV